MKGLVVLVVLFVVAALLARALIRLVLPRMLAGLTARWEIAVAWPRDASFEQAGARGTKFVDADLRHAWLIGANLTRYAKSTAYTKQGVGRFEVEATVELGFRITSGVAMLG